jgi:hypothetical protein
LPLELQEAILADDHRPPGRPVGRPVAWELRDAAHELAGGDAGAALVCDVAVPAGYRIGDTRPGRGGHITPNDDIPRPELLDQLPPAVVVRGDDVADIDDRLQRRGAVQSEAEAVQDAAGVSQLRQELDRDLALIAGTGGGVVLRLVNHPVLWGNPWWSRREKLMLLLRRERNE